MSQNPPTRKSPTAEVQFEMDGLFEYGATKQNLTPTEVARALGITDQKVRDYLDEGLLVAASVAFIPGERDHVRITRFSVVAFWREQLAQKGSEPPFHQTAQVLWWRTELQAKRKLLKS